MNFNAIDSGRRFSCVGPIPYIKSCQETFKLTFFIGISNFSLIHNTVKFV